MKLLFGIGQDPSVAASRLADSEARGSDVNRWQSTFPARLCDATIPNSRYTSGRRWYELEHRSLLAFPSIGGSLAFVFQSLNVLLEAVSMAIILLGICPIQVVESVVCTVIVPVTNLSESFRVRVGQERQGHKPMERNVHHLTVIRKHHPVITALVLVCSPLFMIVNASDVASGRNLVYLTVSLERDGGPSFSHFFCFLNK